jgi:hypothetical protein
MPEIFYHKAIDMSMLDWFATFAPEPNKDDMELQKMYDMNRRCRDDKYVMRSDMQIKCELRYKWAKEMIKARQL